MLTCGHYNVMTRGHYNVMLMLYFLHIGNASAFKMTNPRVTVTLSAHCCCFQSLSSDSLRPCGL